MEMKWDIVVKDYKLVMETNTQRTERKFVKVGAGRYGHIKVILNLSV